MPFLVVGGVTVGVQGPGGATHAVEEIGERQRAFDGTMRTAIRAVKNSWQVSTNLLTRAAADTLVTELNATPPVTCSGDLLGGSVSCHPEYQGMEPTPVAGGLTRYRVMFSLHEA